MCMCVLTLPDSVTVFQLPGDLRLSLSLWLLKKDFLRGKCLTLTYLFPLIIEEHKEQQHPISNTYSYSIEDDALMKIQSSKKGLFLQFGWVLDLSCYTENTRVLRIYSIRKTLDPKMLLGGFHQPNLTKSQQLKNIPAGHGMQYR